MRSVRILSGLGTALAMTSLLIACGGGGGGGNTPTNPTPNPGGGGGGGGGTTGTTVTITASGFSPKELVVPPGTRVTFVNSNNRTHEVNSDPHPDHGDCPEIDQVGFMQPGTTKQTGNLNNLRTCGYHDHILFENPAFQARIIIRN